MPQPAASAAVFWRLHEASQPAVQLTCVTAFAQLAAQVLAASTQVLTTCPSALQFGVLIDPLSQVKLPGLAAHAAKVPSCAVQPSAVASAKVGLHTLDAGYTLLILARLRRAQSGQQ